MSASVYNPEILRIHPVVFAKKSSPLKVKRSLFGPVDHEFNKKFLEKNLEKDYSHFCHKWNFNFREERTLDPDGAYLWSDAAASPVKLMRKRKLADAEETAAECYYKPAEFQENSRFVFQPIEPALVHQQNDSSALRIPKQRVITDYYALKRKSVASGKDKQQPQEARPNPTKIPKYGNCSS